MAKTALYRHFDADGQLLYVGISLNAINRLREHGEGSPWFDDIARVEIEYFPNRLLASQAEAVAIAEENPVHNTNKRFATSCEQDQAIADIWYNRDYAERYKVRRIGEILGREVKRHQIIYRFGTMQTPKDGWKAEHGDDQ